MISASLTNTFLLQALTSDRCGWLVSFLFLVSNEQLKSLRQNNQKVRKIHTSDSQFFKNGELMAFSSVVSQEFPEHLSENGFEKRNTPK